MSARTLVSPRLLPGLILAAAGAVLLLNNLNMVELGDLMRWWPMLLLAFGLHLFLEAGNRTVGALVVAASIVIQLRELDVVEIPWRTLKDFWPLLLIGAGLHLLFRRSNRDSAIGGVVLLTLGGYFLATNLNLIHVALWRLWPVALIALGVGMARRALGR